MNELDRIREQIKHMRKHDYEPNAIYVCYDLWDKMGRKGKFAGVSIIPNDDILERFEVR